MRNDQIASIFDEIADMLELGGENFFRVRAYRNGARAVRDYPESVTALPLDKLNKIAGIGADLAQKSSLWPLPAICRCAPNCAVLLRRACSIYETSRDSAPSESNCSPISSTFETAMT